MSSNNEHERTNLHRVPEKLDHNLMAVTFFTLSTLKPIFKILLPREKLLLFQ